MRTYDAWFPRYALGNTFMFFCRVFLPAVGRGSSALSTFLDCRPQRVKELGTVAPYGCNDQIKGVGTLSSPSCEHTNVLGIFTKQQ